jgi:predicted permease
MPAMSLFLRDLRYGARALLHAPWYALTVVTVLAIGIGLATVAFALADGVLFRPLSYDRAAELFLIHSTNSTQPTRQPPPASWPEIDAWREAVPDLEVTVFSHGSPVFGGTAIDERFLDVLGVRPLLGGFNDDDFAWFLGSERTGQRVRPVLLSYRRWLNEFGGDPNVVGRTMIETHREDFIAGIRIAGVLPPDFVFPLDIGVPQPEMVMPIPRALRRGPARNYHLIARLPAPARLAEVGARMIAASRDLPPPRSIPGHAPAAAPGRFDELRLVPLSEHLARHERPALALVVSASAVLLMLACLTVAGLVAARNIQRRHGLQIRTALGAGPAAIARELVAELTVPAVAAVGLALLIAQPLLVWSLELLPSTVTLLKTPSIDGRVFVFATATSIGTTLLVSLWPALMAARIGAGARFEAADTATRPVRRFARPLVAAQVAGGFVLLVAGGLTLSSLAAAWRNDAGYRRDHMLLLEASVSESGTSAETEEKFQALPRLIESVDGVDAVAMSTIQTMFARRTPPYTNVMPEGWSGAVEGIASRQVSANYFDTMGIRLVDGRWPVPGEWNEPRVAVVSETAARMLWPDQSPIGRTLVWRTRAPRPPLTVIGVVADARYLALDSDPTGDIYLPLGTGPGFYGLFFHVRTTRPSGTVLGPVLAALSGRGYHVDQAATHEDALFASVKHRALPAWLFGSLGFGALVVLGTGIFGLLAMSAALRAREVGIRLTLGATRGRVVALFVREQMTVLTLGLAAGALVSLWGVRLLESRLYGVDAQDPAVWGSVALVILSVALAATLAPALRAVRADPVAALWTE